MSHITVEEPVADPAPAAPSGEKLLEVRGLQKLFPVKRGILFQHTVGQVRAVDGIDFDLHRAE